jgi:hypothetical protein
LYEFVQKLVKKKRNLVGISTRDQYGLQLSADGLRAQDLPPGQDERGRAPRCSAPMANQHSRSPPGEAGPAPRAGIMCPLTLEHPGRRAVEQEQQNRIPEARSLGGRSARCAQSWTAHGWRWSGPKRYLTLARLASDQLSRDVNVKRSQGEDALRRAGARVAARDARSETWTRRGNWRALKGTPGASCWRTGARR